MLTDLADHTTCLSVTVKAANAMQTKISNRLSPGLVELYSQDYEVGDGDKSDKAKSRGMAVLADLHAASAKLEVLQSVVLCVAADAIDAQKLIAGLERASARGIAVGNAIKEHAIIRQLSQHFADKDWISVVAVLSADATPGVDRPLLNLLMLPEENREKFQVAQMYKCLIDVMRPAGNMEVMTNLVAHFTEAKMLSEELQREVQDLALLLDPPHAESSEVLEVAVRSFTDRLSERKLAQALTLFATGQQVIAAAEEDICSRAKDKVFKVDIDSMEKLMDMIKAMSWTQVADGTPQLPDADAFGQLFEAHAKIEANCTLSFKKQHKTVVDRASKVLVQARTRLIDAAELTYVKGEEDVLERLTSGLKKKELLRPAYVADTRMRIDALAKKKIYQHDHISLDRITKPDMECVKLFHEKANWHLAFLGQLSSCTESLCSDQWQWDFIADSSATFLDMIQAIGPCEGQKTPSHRVAFHDEVHNSLRARALKILATKTEHLQPFLKSIDKADMQEERADRFKCKADWHIVDEIPASPHREVATLAHALLVKHTILLKETDTVHSHGIYLVSVAASLHDLLKAVSEQGATTDTTELVMTVIPSLSTHADDVKAFVHGLQPDKWSGEAGKDASDTCTAVLRDVQCCVKQQVAKVLGEFEGTLQRDTKALQDAAARDEVPSLMKMCSAGATHIVEEKDKIMELTNSDACKDFYRAHNVLKVVIDQVASDEFMKVVGIAMKHKLPCHSSFDAERSKSDDVKKDSVPIVYTMTIVQAMFRPLAVGETRPTLMARCKAIIDVKILPSSIVEVMEQLTPKPKAKTTAQPADPADTGGSDEAEKKGKTTPKKSGKTKPKQVAKASGKSSKTTPKKK